MNNQVRFLNKHLLSVEGEPFSELLLRKLNKRICYPERYVQAANLIITNILVHGNVRISKNNNYYSIPNRYKPEYFTRNYILTMLQLLVREGYVNELRGFYNNKTGEGRRTLISPTEKLIKEFDTLTIGRNKPKELVELRDCNKKLIDYYESDLVKRMRNEIHSMNEAIGNTKIELALPVNNDSQSRSINSMNYPVPYTSLQAFHIDRSTSLQNNRSHHVLRQSLEKIRIQSIFTGLKRIFNNSNFKYGGRYYDAGFFSYQTMKSELRSLIIIENTPVIELDFGNMFPLMLYHKQGLSFEGDTYQIMGYNRKDVKLALNIMLNAKSKDSALRRLRLDRIENPEELLLAIEKKHKPLIRFFYSSVAIELMKIESEILTEILITLISENIIPLPVHDSILVKDLMRETEALNETMSRSYKKRFDFEPIIRSKKRIPSK